MFCWVSVLVAGVVGDCMAAFWLSPAIGVEHVEMFLSVPPWLLGTGERVWLLVWDSGLAACSVGVLSFCFLLHLAFLFALSVTTWFCPLALSVDVVGGVEVWL